MAKEHIDPETQKISDKNNELKELVNHSGWKVARGLLVDKIVELQNVSEYIDVIQTGNATKLLREMKANKRSAEILFDWLRQIEGSAQQAVENKDLRKRSFIVNLDDED